MKVAVNKQVLFELLKKQLNENRTENVYMFGAAAASGDPFFKEDEDLPIEPSQYSANQIFKKVPDVSDPDWSPSNPEEMGDAAKELAKAIPPDKLAKLYSMMHRNLDDIADSLQESNTLSNDVIDISKMTKIRDFNILSEAIENNNDEITLEELSDEKMAIIKGLPPPIFKKKGIKGGIISSEKVIRKINRDIFLTSQ